MCFSSVCISTLSWPWYVSVQHVFLCYPLLMLCFSSACIFMLSCPCYVSVQHVFWRYPLLMMLNTVYISVLFSPYAVFQVSMYLHTILSKLCFSSACILVLSLWCVQFSVYFCAILSLCCISVQCVFPHYPVQAMFQFSTYYDVFSVYLHAILSLCCVSVQRVFSTFNSLKTYWIIRIMWAHYNIPCSVLIIWSRTALYMYWLIWSPDFF